MLSLNEETVTEYLLYAGTILDKVDPKGDQDMGLHLKELMI